MKCSKCGKLNDDKYLFCSNCGQKIVETSGILFEFKPKYNFKYRFLSSVLFWFSIFSIPYVILILFNLIFNSLLVEFILYSALIIYVPFLIYLIFLISYNVFDYNRYEKTNVQVYKDRLIIVTNFINRTEREILFEDISSLTIYQNGGQIRYNLGNIGITIDELKNNKSTILLNDIENVGVVYQKLKNLKGGDKNDM